MGKFNIIVIVILSFALMFPMKSYSHVNNENDVKIISLENGSEYYFNKDLNKVFYWLPVVVEYTLIKSKDYGNYFISLNLFLDLKRDKETKNFIQNIFPNVSLEMGSRRKLSSLFSEIPEIRDELKILYSLSSLNFQSTFPISNSSIELLQKKNNNHDLINLETKYSVVQLYQEKAVYRINDYCSSISDFKSDKISLKEFLIKISKIKRTNKENGMKLHTNDILISRIINDCVVLDQSLPLNKKLNISAVNLNIVRSQSVIYDPIGDPILKHNEINKKINIQINYLGESEI